jgi:hypothetical protein
MSHSHLHEVFARNVIEVRKERRDLQLTEGGQLASDCCRNEALCPSPHPGLQLGEGGGSFLPPNEVPPTQLG